MHDSSYQNMTYFVDKYLKKMTNNYMRILDIGSQDVNGTYRNLFNHDNWEYVGLDMSQGRNVDIVVRDAYDWKEVQSNSFDVAISGQTLEHIRYPWITMCEIYRVLKYDGLCCMIVPSSGPEHRYPIDCYRFFPDGLMALADFAGLKAIESYNCWENTSKSSKGTENIWKDSVLICSKKNDGQTIKIKRAVRNFLTKAIGRT